MKQRGYYRHVAPAGISKVLGLEGYQHRVTVVYIYIGAHLGTFTIVAEQHGGFYCVTVALWGGRIVNSAPRDGVLGRHVAGGSGAGPPLVSHLHLVHPHSFQALEVHYIL